jgi:hypothetical protein
MSNVSKLIIGVRGTGVFVNRLQRYNIFPFKQTFQTKKLKINVFTHNKLLYCTFGAWKDNNYQQLPTFPTDQREVIIYPIKISVSDNYNYRLLSLKNGKNTFSLSPLLSVFKISHDFVIFS